MAEIISPNLQDAAIAFGEDPTRKCNLPGEREPGDVLIYRVTIDVTTPLGSPVDVPIAERIGEPVEQPGGATPFEVSVWWGVEDGSAAPTITYDSVERFCIVDVALIRHARHEPPALAEVVASPESREIVRGPSQLVAVAKSMALLIGSALDEAAEYESIPEGMFSELESAGILLAAESNLEPGETGDRDAVLVDPEWNVGGLLIFEPKDPPANTDPPVLSGTAEVGDTLAVSTGSWTNEPTGYTYQWELSTAEDGWIYIPEGTEDTLEVTETFRGRKLRCIVTAANEGGSEEEPSNGSAVVPGGTVGTHIKRVALNRGGNTVIPVMPGSAVDAVLFDGATLADYYILQEADGAITEVPDPAGSEETVFKLEVSNDDVFPETPTEDPRAQLDSYFMVPDGAVWEMEGAFYLPADWPDEIPAGGWVQLFQYFGKPYEGSPPWGVKFANDELMFQRNATYSFDKPWGTRKWKKEHWTEVKMRALQSREGWLEMWIDGERVTFFDPDEDKFSTHNPNKEPMDQRLEMETIDDSNFGEPNLAALQSYRALDFFESLTMYHKPLIVRAI